MQPAEERYNPRRHPHTARLQGSSPVQKMSVTRASSAHCAHVLDQDVLDAMEVAAADTARCRGSRGWTAGDSEGKEIARIFSSGDCALTGLRHAPTGAAGL